jgi:hypothetical protein
MEEILKQILTKLNDMEQRFEQRFDEMDKRFDRIETELEDVKRVVRLSAEDIVESQVEYTEKNDLLDQRIRLLEDRQNYTDKRISKLEKAK